MRAASERGEAKVPIIPLVAVDRPYAERSPARVPHESNPRRARGRRSRARHTGEREAGRRATSVHQHVLRMVVADREARELGMSGDTARWRLRLPAGRRSIPCEHLTIGWRSGSNGGALNLRDGWRAVDPR